MNNKKITTFILAGIMALSMCACGETEEKSSTASKAETTAKAAETEAPTEAPATTEAIAETEEETTEEETEPEAYTFADGMYMCETFNITVPDGWVLLTDYCAKDRVRIGKAASEDDFDVFSNPKLSIRVPGYRYGSKDDEYNSMDHVVENDKQFFKDKEATVEDYSFVDYTGKKLSGESSAYTNCHSVFYEAQLWSEDEEHYSALSMDATYYSDDELAEIEEIINGTLELKVMDF